MNIIIALKRHLNWSYSILVFVDVLPNNSLQAELLAHRPTNSSSIMVITVQLDKPLQSDVAVSEAESMHSGMGIV